jgi:hypothetical protein
VANITELLLNPSNSSNQSLINHEACLNLNTSSEAIDLLLEEGGESFYKYVNWLGLSDEPDLIVLSSKHHYYYDPEEMNNTRTVINLKELNNIKHIKPFLQSCLGFLPKDSNFIGCFVDNEKLNGYELRKLSVAYPDKNRENEFREDELENGIVSRFPFLNMLYSLIDSKTNNYMSKKSIALLLKEFDFRVIDMTESNGFTFFHAQKFHTFN